jgi:hypothetical protein
VAKTVLDRRAILTKGVPMSRIVWLSALITCFCVLFVGFVSGST